MGAFSIGSVGAAAALAVGLSLGACSPSHATPPDDAGADAADAADATPAPAEWTPVLEHLDGALLSVWGTSERDVWTLDVNEKERMRVVDGHIELFKSMKGALSETTHRLM